MTYELEDIKMSLEFLRRLGPHAPGTSSNAYVEHVQALLDKIDRLNKRVERCECPAMFFYDLE